MHRSFSGQDPAPVMRQRGFESHLVLSIHLQIQQQAPRSYGFSKAARTDKGDGHGADARAVSPRFGTQQRSTPQLIWVGSSAAEQVLVKYPSVGSSPTRPFLSELLSVEVIRLVEGPVLKTGGGQHPLVGSSPTTSVVDDLGGVLTAVLMNQQADRPAARRRSCTPAPVSRK